ncbi:LysR family transcriptional regulator [Bordetella ansorpii]|jgi:DNA-binding transcriptional LysR family regulator|uniref:LysR family transcriptional regulator n=1 Tax=Bordetella ansorpii TaxID=288768 RepID=A0A157ME72_9BORD|nr:LysR family transcriptional regulator [Bordetella ansorpii]SAI07367.1 LysR family transcriptional regulator [Bordetella ansorpii]
MSSIRTLKTFLAVARHGSFAAAGKHIGLTPAAVGLQIRALETELRCQLFDRGARAAVLNPSARRLLPQIQELVRDYEDLADAGASDGLSGSVVMGALVSALMGAFSDALWSLKRDHPRLDVRLYAGMSSDFAQRVETGELDAAVVTQPPRALPSMMMWTPLYSEPLVLVVPRQPHFALSADPVDALHNAPFLRFDHGTWTGYLVDEAVRQCGAAVQVGMELNSVEAIVELVRQGMGISIVPQLANVAWHRDRALRVIPLPGVDVHRHVGLLERRQHARYRFTDAVKAYFSDRSCSTGRRR